MENSLPIIGYDLDGVLCPDIDIAEIVNNMPEGTLQNVLSARQMFMPMFRPRGKFAVITGRPHSDYCWTSAWLHKHFYREHVLAHNTHKHLDDEASAEFKSMWVKKWNLKVFVESSEKISALMVGQCEGVKIVSFAEFISTQLANEFWT